MSVKTPGLILFAAASAPALFLLARPRPAAAIAGGTLNLPSSAVVTGGLRSTGATLVNYSAIGGHGTLMSGGTMSLIPGPLASAKTARMNTSDSHAYPTPFMPSKGHDRITFSQLPALVTVKVFTLSGRLVKTLEKNDSTDSLVWRPVVNDQGAPLASGVYPFTVIQPGVSKRQGKVMVVK